MSWIRSSRFAALVVLLALSLAVVGSASAISTSAADVPNETKVGESVSVTITIEDPFVDMPDTWTLEGSTALENVSWTLTILQQGEQVSQNTYGDQGFEQGLNSSNGGDTLELQLTGTTPDVENFTYDPPETYTLYDLDTRQGNSTAELNETAVHHYTNSSKDARLAIDNATMAVNESSTQEARDQLNRSIDAYNNGNFGNAEDLAGDAQGEAEQAEQSQQQTQLILYGVAALVVVALVGGGIYYWRSQQEEYGKLQ